MSQYIVELKNFQEYIKINVKDTSSFTTYEKILWEFDIKDSHFKTLDKTSFFFEKCIDNDNYQNYTYQIEEVNEQLLLTFKANIDELINIESKYLLDKITINEYENESSMLTIRDIENKMILKMNEKIQELEEKYEKERNDNLTKINKLENKLILSNKIIKNLNFKINKISENLENQQNENQILVNINKKIEWLEWTVEDIQNERNHNLVKINEFETKVNINKKIERLEWLVEDIQNERNHNLVKINEFETKLNLSNKIPQKIQHLYDIISGCEIPIYYDLPHRVPLSLNFLHINFYGHDHKKPNIDNINKLFNLKKLIISIERNFGYHNLYNFDIRLFNNYVLEELLLTNYSYYDNKNIVHLRTIECLIHLKTLKKIELSGCQGLMNISDYLHNFSNLNFLKISGCPGIIATDKIKLEKYCSENNIELVIS
jgi:hypothetical protein